MQTEVREGVDLDVAKLGVVILNFNGLKDTVNCLESIRCLETPEVRIIVVDNASTDGSALELTRRFPDITIVRNERNLGFAEGMNRGIVRAFSMGLESVLLLNNDTIVEDNVLKEILDYADTHPEVSIVGPAVCVMENPETTQFPWMSSVRGPVETTELSGAALFVRLEVFTKVGLLDPLFFMYWEEGDFLERCKRNGYRAVYLPTRARVLHRTQATSSGAEGLFNYYMIRNGFLYTRRHKKLLRFLKHVVLSLAWMGTGGMSRKERVACLKGIRDGLSLFLRNPAPPAPLSQRLE